MTAEPYTLTATRWRRLECSDRFPVRGSANLCIHPSSIVLCCVALSVDASGKPSVMFAYRQRPPFAHDETDRRPSAVIDGLDNHAAFSRLAWAAVCAAFPNAAVCPTGAPLLADGVFA